MTKSLAIKFEIYNGGNFAEASILFNCAIQSCGTVINELYHPLRIWNQLLENDGRS